MITPIKKNTRCFTHFCNPGARARSHGGGRGGRWGDNDFLTLPASASGYDWWIRTVTSFPRRPKCRIEYSYKARCDVLTSSRKRSAALSSSVTSRRRRRFIRIRHTATRRLSFPYRGDYFTVRRSLPHRVDYWIPASVTGRDSDSPKFCLFLKENQLHELLPLWL
jgi:hypothetical protein